MPPASRCSPSCRSSSPSSTSSATSCPPTSAARRAHCGSEASFLFIPDLTAKATGGVLIALLVLYVGTQLVSGMVMAVTADKSQRMMMFVLPFIFVPFVINFPAGLVLYWITTNVWTIGQQYAIQRLIPAPAMRHARGGRGGQAATAAAQKEEAAAGEGRHTETGPRVPQARTRSAARFAGLQLAAFGLPAAEPLVSDRARLEERPCPVVLQA